jgi:hypothetical protein
MLVERPMDGAGAARGQGGEVAGEAHGRIIYQRASAKGSSTFRVSRVFIRIAWSDSEAT